MTPTPGPVPLPIGSLESILAGIAASVLGSLFAAGDAALQSLPEPHLQALSAGAGAEAAAFRRFAADRIRTLSRWLVGRVLCLSTTAALFTQAAARWLSPNLAILASIVGAVLTYGTLAELLGTFARRRPERVGALALRVLSPLETVFVPLAWPLASLGRLVGRRVPEEKRVDARLAETEVEWAVSVGERTGSIANEPAEMIRNVLDFKDLTAREVMVPRRKISAIALATPLEAVLALVTADGHSRYPVYGETLDNVVGTLYVKDLFAIVRDKRLGAAKLSEIVRSPVLFVVETQPAASVLREMRAKRLHMAIVSDEFGGTSGLVTLEDILEEIVGEIRDEYDTEAETQLEKVGDDRFVADAAISINDLEDKLGRTIPPQLREGDFESLGGLLVHRAGRVPAVGTSLTVDGLKFTVREADETHIVKVEIAPADEVPKADASQPTVQS